MQSSSQHFDKTLEKEINVCSHCPSVLDGYGMVLMELVLIDLRVSVSNMAVDLQ